VRLRHVPADLAAGLALIMAVATATWAALDLPVGYLGQALALYVLLAAAILRSAPSDLPGPGLGPANRITLARATLLLSVTALVFQPNGLGSATYWWIIVVSTVAMVLDGVDGWVARRTGTATAFGARLDMELDAALLLALAVLVWLSGKVGPWVILIGALRYLFVGAGWIWPVLQVPLPPSRRRKIVCVVQGIVLLVCLGPIIPASLATAAATGALASLIYSFAADVRWLLQSARTAH
jgi:phosphatidylglycerophosphate synthase